MESAPSLENLIASRLKSRRQALALTLDEAAAASGVARATISKIERCEVSASAAILGRLAAGLGMTMAELFASPASHAPLIRRADQPVFVDPASGYVRRTVTPAGGGLPFDLVDVSLPAGARVAFEIPTRGAPHQAVYVLEGAVAVTHGEATHRLAAGDCLRLALDRPVAFMAADDGPARYIVAVSATAGPTRG
jgi:quercetin dioxygenase-like cupin family protein/DNA-binding XRE family transcriptional regulator